MVRFVWIKYIFWRKNRDLFGQNSLPLQRFVSIAATSVFLISNISSMGRPKRLYPLGRYRLHIRGEIDPAKQYLVQLEYTWNRQVIRKGMNIFVRLGDWNEKCQRGTRRREGELWSGGQPDQQPAACPCGQDRRTAGRISGEASQSDYGTGDRRLSGRQTAHTGGQRGSSTLVSSLFSKGSNLTIPGTGSVAAAMKTARAA